MSHGWPCGALLGLMLLAGASGTLCAQRAPQPEPGAGTIAARLGEVAADDRDAWREYVATSMRLAAVDRATMARELAAAGRDTMIRAPYAARAFDGGAARPAAWWATDESRRLAEVILSFQTPAGGWAKRVAYDSARAMGQSWYSESEGWSYIGTFDNSTTTTQVAFLGRLHQAQPDPRYAAAFARGVAYITHAQYPNGCWPQVYPLQGQYHDAVTFNDEVTVNVLHLLDGVAGGAFPFASDSLRTAAAAAARRGVDCILGAQLRVNGRRTAWGQQHDPITLAPVAARSYELRSLSGRESAGLMTYLMSLPQPDARIAAAIHATAAHFRATAIHGLRYDYERGVTEAADAGPIWARMLEIGTNRPIFANRDGVKRYDFRELTDRRTGYAWFGTEPASALEKYAKWLRQHPAYVPVEK